MTQKAYGVKWDEKPEWWHTVLGPLGLGLHQAAKIKRGWVDPFGENEVQPRVNEALNTPIAGPTSLATGRGPTSVMDDIKLTGKYLGGVASAATGQTPEQGAAGGEALAEYLTKSSLASYLGGAPLEGLDDATKLRALNELEDLNKHPVLAHWIRKSAVPMTIKLADQMLTENADLAAAAQESLLKEASLLPLYLINPGRLAVLEGEGIGLALARGAYSGGASSVPGSLASTTDVSPEGVRKEVPQNLDTAVLAGAAIGGAVEGGFKVAADGVRGVGKALDVGGRAQGVMAAAQEATERAKYAREDMPVFDKAPVVIGLSSDAVEQMAESVRLSAIENQVKATAIAGHVADAKAYREVPRTDTKFKPNIVVLGMEGDVPVVRAVQVDQAGGAHAGVTIPLDSPQAIDEVLGLSKRWGASPIVNGEAILSGNPNVAPFLPQVVDDVAPVPVTTKGTNAASPRAQLRQRVNAGLADAVVPPAAKREPGFMIMTESSGGNPGAWQIHQLNDPVKRSESLLERGLSEVTMPDGNTRLGFVRHIDDKGKVTVLAPAHEEGIPDSLMFDLEVPGSKVKPLDRAGVDKLAKAEPAALKAERELYRKARPVASVEELLQTFEKFAARDPETMDLVNKYTQRKADKVLKGSIESGGVVLADENVSIDLGAKERVRTMLRQEGLNSSLVDHLVHVANKRRAGLKPTDLEMRLLTEEWKAAEKAVRSGRLGTVHAIDAPDVIGAPTKDVMEPGMSLAPDDQVILTSGETGSMVALTKDTAVIRVNDTLRSVHPDEIVAQAADAPPVPDGPVPAADLPPAAPPPPVTGVPPKPPPPQNIPANAVLVREYLSQYNKIHNLMVPAYSRGPQDVAQWALIMSSIKSLEATVRSDVYSRLNKVFGRRSLEFNESLNHYISGRTDLPEQEKLLNKFPEVSLSALKYTDGVVLRSQLLEQKLVELNMLNTEAADRLDPVHLTNSYLRWMNGPGEWAKLAAKKKGLEARVIRRIKLEEFSPDQRAKMSAEDLEYKAREFYNELIGLNDKAHAAQKASMGSATKSLMTRNLELPPEYIEAMGGITDPGANVAITLARQEALVAQGSVYSDISKSQWSSAGDKPQPDVKGWGSWHLVEGAKFGQLNGRYVHPQVWEAISNSSEMPARVHTFANALLDTIKRNRTIYNPNAWATNVMGNIQGSILSGGLNPLMHPIQSGIQFAKALQLVAGSARWDVASANGQLLNRARALGVFTPGLAGSEMGMLRDFEKAVTGMQTRMGSKFSIMDAMKKLASIGVDSASGFSHKIGAVYDGVDQAFKMGNWLALRARGLKNPERFLGSQFDELLPPARLQELVEREAARRVATSFPMPHAPSAAAAKLRTAASGAVGAMNPFMTMQLEEMRIYANIVARFRGQGGEAGTEFAGRLLAYSLFASAMTATLAGMRRSNGISDEEVALAKESMSDSAQAYKPGLLAMYWRDEQTGNPRFIDFTSGISALRLTQGNSEEESLVNRVFYNALKTPVSGTPAEAWVDQTMRLGGFDAAPAGFSQKPTPNQLRSWKGMVDSLATAGVVPMAASTVPRALNQAGMLGTPPKDPFTRLSPAEGVANALGAKITPGGNPSNKAKELLFKRVDAQKAMSRSYSLPEGEQPGIRSLGMQNDKIDVQKNAAEDLEKANKAESRHRDLMNKAGK